MTFTVPIQQMVNEVYSRGYELDIHSFVSIILANVSFGSLGLARKPTTKIGGSKFTIWKKLNGARLGTPIISRDNHEYSHFINIMGIIYMYIPSFPTVLKNPIGLGTIAEIINL